VVESERNGALSSAVVSRVRNGHGVGAVTRHIHVVLASGVVETQYEDAG